ncbi:MAG: peptidylprolyl isomerase, partial [Pseudomonadota bacterium]|nr:peptidylprolyl isomerase [Pseudomonadota bacterium]
PVLSAFRAAVVSVGAGMGLMLAVQTALAQEEPKIPVASVNGEEIFLDEVMALTDRLPAELRQQPLETYFDRLVDDIIDSRLAAAAGNGAGLTEDPEILRRMSIAAQRVLAEAWISREIRKRVTEDDLKSAYETYVADTGSREEVKARHILVAEKQTAEEIIKQLDDGADFIALAKEKSTGPSGPNGGDLGYFGRGAMVPAFETAAFALAAGDYSKTPVQTQFGWHVILAEDKRTAQPPSFEELAPQLRQNLISQNLARLLDGLRQDADVSKRSFADIRNDAQAAAQGASGN